MTLSEAMREGRRKRPEDGRTHFFDGSTTDALGAAYEAAGLITPVDGVKIYDLVGREAEIVKAFPRILDRVACPACLAFTGALGSVINHLRAYHNWSTEHIADWVESSDHSHEGPSTYRSSSPLC